MGTRGFTLIEALVSFTLLAVVLAASYDGFFQGMDAEDRAATRIEAVYRAEARLAALRASGAVPVTQIFQEGDWRDAVSVTPGDIGGLYRVRVEVTGPDGGTVLTSQVYAP